MDLRQKVYYAEFQQKLCTWRVDQYWQFIQTSFQTDFKPWKFILNRERIRIEWYGLTLAEVNRVEIPFWKMTKKPVLLTWDQASCRVPPGEIRSPIKGFSVGCMMPLPVSHRLRMNMKNIAFACSKEGVVKCSTNLLEKLALISLNNVW